ncbi:alpha-2-macroglobulin receptor-associated protein-like [Amphiura filiformis]|uniref:alpha-2-macroglobulin receptor-associated protein-like n=1 Tax=Amphiura filiformis TaxID=82378 RepID=UPI003B221161
MNSKMERLILTFILIVCINAFGKVEGGSIPGGKYEEKTNKIPEMGEKPEFRSRNVIQVWEKAKRMELSETKMAELKGLLATHDQKAWQVKKDHREGKDIGDADAKLKIKLNQIMQRFGMARGAPDNQKALYNDVNRDFEDQRLEQLWRHAQTQDHFDKHELDELKKELMHHQDQLNEYNALAEDIYGPLNDAKKEKDRREKRNAKDNMTPTGDDPADPAKRRARELDLKLKHRDLNKDYQRLRTKMTPEEERGGFEDRRVISLWNDAVEASFSDEELESIKEELQAFEAKIHGYEEAQKAALREEKMYHNLKSRGENPDVQKHHTLRETAKELGSKISETMGSWRKALTAGRIHKEL